MSLGGWDWVGISANVFRVKVGLALWLYCIASVRGVFPGVFQNSRFVLFSGWHYNPP